MFCSYFGLSYLPATTEILCLYSQFLSRSMKSVQFIKNYLSGMKTLLMLLSYSVEHINSFIINLGLKGMARLKPYCIKQADAITPTKLKQIYSVITDHFRH